MLGLIISNKQATLHELETVYSLNDAHVIYNIIATDNYNSETIRQNMKLMEKS
jgi:hypothetical protein